MRFVDYFDRIYVLHLPHRTDRLKKMEKELEQAGMTFTPGKVELFPAIKPESPEPFTSIGFKGCFLSHLAILKQAKEQQLNTILILEDDLKLTDTLKYHEVAVVEQLQRLNWDMVYLGYRCPTPIQKEGDPASATVQVCPWEVFETHMYGVNQQVFDKLIQFLETLLQRPPGHPLCGPVPYDGALNVFQWQNQDVARFISVPSLAAQISSRSDISPKWFDHLPILSSAVTIARDLGIARTAKRILAR
jgi:glycosyl transferase, family 25